MLVILPENPDASAKSIRGTVQKQTGLQVAVVITDTWGRPWREGLTNIAIGVAGIHCLQDYRETLDVYGRELHATALAVVDELASAAELVMGKIDQIPVAIIRGYQYPSGPGTISELFRAPERDIFR